MASSFKLWTYTDDAGVEWTRNVLLPYSTQVDGGAAPKIGGAASLVAGTPMPNWIKPRVALCADASGNVYRIVCNTNDCNLYTTANATFDIYDRDGGAAVTVTRYGIEGERRRHKKVK